MQKRWIHKPSHILPALLSLVTGPRYYEHEKFLPHSWSSCAFIAFRKVFWRKAVLQPQATSWSDSSGRRGRTFHTFESAIVHGEAILRQWLAKPSLPYISRLRLVKVYLPVFQYVGLSHHAKLNGPYLFAIAHDTDTSKASTSNTTSPITNTHTCASGSIGIGGYCTDNAATDPTTLTYNSASLSKAVALSSGSNQSIWYITSPTTGSALTWSYTPAATSWQTGGFTSWTGANTSALIGTTGSNSGSSSAVSTTITTTTANSYVQDNFYLNDRSKTATPDSPATLAWNADTGPSEGTRGESSYKSTTTAGSYTLSWTLSGSSVWRSVMVEIKPASAGGGSSIYGLSLMGCGT